MAKLTDIGIVGQYRETERSIIYLSPEVLKKLQVRMKESDVYSYGIMLWEMWYGMHAFNELKPLELNPFREKIVNGDRPKKPQELTSIPEVEEIIEKCWRNEASERPSAKECKEVFQNIITRRICDN